MAVRFTRIAKMLISIFTLERLTRISYSFCSVLFPLNNKLVLIESHKGERFGGNPYYILKYLLDDSTFRSLRFIVVCSRQQEYSTLRTVFASSRVGYCRPGSPPYGFYLATAGFLINDVSFPTYFSRRIGQRYLNTWHGTPIKALGISVSNTLHSNLRNMQRNFFHATHIVFPNEHTETVLRRDYCLDGLWSGTAIRCGYPRNDVLVRRAKCKHSNSMMHIAYMPTWRGTHETLTTASRCHASEVATFTKVFAENAPPSLTLWVKLHPLMQGKLDFSNHRNVHEFPSELETYEHLALCDALVTDYSSVMVDFASGGGRVLLFIPDLEAYRLTQSFSIEPKQLPFPTFQDAKELLRALSNISAKNMTNTLLESLLLREDGNSAQRVSLAFFGGIAGFDASPNLRRLALVLVEKRMDSNTRASLDSVVAAIRVAGMYAVIATPGEQPEDPLMVSLVKEGGVIFCPSVSTWPYNRIKLFSILAGQETYRLFATRRFKLVVQFGDCTYYRRLLAEFPPSVRYEYEPRDAESHDTLLTKIKDLTI